MKLLLAIILLLLSGCATVTVERGDCKATYSTFYKDLEAANFNVCGGYAEVVESRSNTELLKAIITALGAAK